MSDVPARMSIRYLSGRFHDPASKFTRSGDARVRTPHKGGALPHYDAELSGGALSISIGESWYDIHAENALVRLSSGGFRFDARARGREVHASSSLRLSVSG